MKRVLICSIIRNCRPYLDQWFVQIKQLCELISEEYDIAISVYENDSTDGSDQWLRQIGGKNCIVITEKLGTRLYGSIWSIERLNNLARARQKCIDQADFAWKLSTFDKIVFIEPDVSYDPNWCKELILARHPLAAGIGEPDVYSAWSLRSLANPKESFFLYDTTACRQTSSDICWSFDREIEWRNQSLIRTDLGGFDVHCLHSVWTTFNCFCAYNAKPFVGGLKWSCINTRLNTGQCQLNNGWLDADTTVICEDFRRMGYDKIFLNTNCIVRHR